MATYEFTGVATTFKSNFTSTTLNISDNGVKFTWSATGGGGAGDGNNIGAFAAGRLTADPGVLGTSETFSLAPTAPTAGTAPMTRFSGNVIVDLSFVQGTLKVSFHKTGGGVDTAILTAAGTAQATGIYSHNSFTFSGGGFPGFSLDSLTATVNCFLGGTRIATPGGSVPVETLAPGDQVLTADGGVTTVRWLGEQPVNVRLSHPAKVNPIRISAGALAEGMPARDLWVSADHALAIDGHLINAGALVNGETITQVRDMPLDGFTYYHVETDAHERLLAEGVAAETFIDYAGRDSFVNGDERGGAPLIPEMDLPRISDARLVPEALRARLAARAEDKLGVRYAAE